MSFYLKRNSKLIAKVEISKKGFFGSKSFIVFFITPNLRLITLEKKIECNFPFEKNKIIDLNVLNLWIEKNNFELSFYTSNSHLKRQLFYYFDDSVNKNKVRKKKYAMFNHTLFKKNQNTYIKCKI